MCKFIPLCTPILIRFPGPVQSPPSVPTAPKERPWQVGARPGPPRFRPRPKRCAPAGFWVTLQEVTLGGQLTPFSACSIHTICIINVSMCIYIYVCVWLCVCHIYIYIICMYIYIIIYMYIYNYIYISSKVNGINVNTRMLFLDGNGLLNFKPLWLSHAGLIQSPSSVLRLESCNLDAITLLALAESSSSWTLLNFIELYFLTVFGLNYVKFKRPLHL